MKIKYRINGMKSIIANCIVHTITVNSYATSPGATLVLNYILRNFRILKSINKNSRITVNKRVSCDMSITTAEYYFSTFSAILKVTICNPESGAKIEGNSKVIVFRFLDIKYIKTCKLDIFRSYYSEEMNIPIRPPKWYSLALNLE